jgi:hypothetical protein
MRWRLRGFAVAAAAACLLQACASAPPPRPPPPDPDAELVAALTLTLKLDAVQQKRTRELLKEMADRDDAIHAGWAKGKRVRAEEILISHGQFEKDFFVMLTSEQKQIFIQKRTRLMSRVH